MQIKCIARCFGPMVRIWCIDKEAAKQGEQMVQMKFASKHYKPTIKLALQKNTWQFLVGHKKSRDTFVSSTITTLFYFTRNTRAYFEALF